MNGLNKQVLLMVVFTFGVCIVVIASSEPQQIVQTFMGVLSGSLFGAWLLLLFWVD